MNTDNNDREEGGLIESEALGKALSERYLTYALSTIMNRALPDARDGLKPVHRRILYAMRGLKLDPQGAFRKCAKIVGEVMGNYHPHGDQAIYDALARLAQDFNIRYPLVDGQGNFGNIDGDNPAAQRYTEARLTFAAQELLEGLNENAVDFQDNYDGSEEEPVVLPASFPHLLANGSSGIAVGMATQIPPHNLSELIAATKHLIKFPNAGHGKLLEFVQGPDFPTGGVIVEDKEAILNAYESGRGSFRVRSRWEVEDLGRGQWQIIVTEIPYLVKKSKLIEKIAELIELKKLPLLGDVRDESAEDIRLVLEPKSKNVEPAVLMEMLFKSTDLENRFSLNMNVLIDGRVPKVSSLREVLRAFLDHRREVLTRRSRFRLEKIDIRLEVLEGYIVAFLNLDRVIQIIREEDDPKSVMIMEFDLNDAQAEAILNMRLRALRKLEELALRKERDDLMVERASIEDLLGDEEFQWKRISQDLDEVGGRFKRDPILNQRRTIFDAVPNVADVPLEAMIEKEPVTIICSQMGWIRAMKGHVDLAGSFKFKDGDGPKFAFHVETTDKVLLGGSNGRFYTLNVHELPGGRGMGEPVRLMIDLPNEVDIRTLFVHQAGRRRLLASKAGNGFVVPEDELVASTKNGKQVINVGTSELQSAPIANGDHIAVVGENRKVLIFPVAEIPELVKGKGVRLQKYKDGGLSDACVFVLKNGLSWLDPAGRTRTEFELDDWLGSRASAGRMAPRGFPKENKFT